MEDAQKLSSLKAIAMVAYALVILDYVKLYRIVKGAMYLSENRPLPIT